MRYLFNIVFAICTTSFSKTSYVKSDLSNETTPIKMKIIIGTAEFDATLYESKTTEALKSFLPLTIRMNELNGNEKYHYLLHPLPAKETAIGKIQTGDLMLYGDNCLVLFYKTFTTTYTYTRIGRLNDTTGLAAALGNDKVTVTFEQK